MRKDDEFCIKNEKICIKTRKCVSKSRNFVFKMMNFAELLHAADAAVGRVWILGPDLLPSAHGAG